MPTLYYVYSLIDPYTALPFYVGQGKYGRVARGERYQDHLLEAIRYENGKRWPSINRAKLEAIIAIWSQGGNPSVKIEAESECREIIDAHERDLIKRWGRLDIGTGILTNMTDGGTGGVTCDQSIVADRKSAAMRRYHASLSETERSRLAAARGVGVSSHYNSLSASEKQYRLERTILSPIAIEHSRQHLVDCNYYQDDVRRASRSEKAIAHWANMPEEDRQIVVERLSQVRPQRQLDDANRKRSRTLKELHRTQPDLWINLQSGETRRKRGDAIRLGLAKRTPEQWEETKRKKQETRRKNREMQCVSNVIHLG
jgi:hypothetical protein